MAAPPAPRPISDDAEYSKALRELERSSNDSFRIGTRGNVPLKRLLHTQVTDLCDVEKTYLTYINIVKLLVAIGRLYRLPSDFNPPDDDQLGRTSATGDTSQANADLLMPFSFISVASDAAPVLRVGEIPDAEFDELARQVFEKARTYRGPVDRVALWPGVVNTIRTQDDFKTANEDTRRQLAINMELELLCALLEMLFSDDRLKITETSSPDIHFHHGTRTDWTLFSTLKKRFVACVEIKTHSIKRFIETLINGCRDGEDKSYYTNYTKFCQQLLAYLIQYETNRLVLTDGRWYVLLEISGDPILKDAVDIPIRFKVIDSFDATTDMTPIVVLLYCVIKSRNPSADELQRIKNVRHLVLYNKMARDHGVSPSPFFVAILKQVRDSFLQLKEQECPTFIDEACRCLDSKSGWLYLRFDYFDYNHSEPLKVMIVQERE
jgi:hypothetical protein